jgi:hypothetical protein
MRLRAPAKQSEDADQTRRLLALAVVYDGGSRSAGAEAGGVGLQTFRDWVVGFNAAGPVGLVDGRRLAKSRVSTRSSGGNWHSLSRVARSRRHTVWFGGGYAIWRSG